MRVGTTWNTTRHPRNGRVWIVCVCVGGGGGGGGGREGVPPDNIHDGDGWSVGQGWGQGVTEAAGHAPDSASLPTHRPTSNHPTATNRPQDLIIYEMPVRSFTADKSSGLDEGMRGTFLGVAEKVWKLMCEHVVRN